MNRFQEHHDRILKMNDLGKQVMKHRYLYYVKAMPVMSDWEYDKLETKAKEDPENSYLEDYPGSDIEESYPEEIKNLRV